MPFRQENRLNDLKYNDNRYLRASGPTQTVSTTVVFEGSQGLEHGQLSNMPDTTGIVTDHDNRLVAKVQTTTPTVPAAPFKGQLWYNPSQGLTGFFGATGIQGETGLQGTQGETGLQGTQGIQGVTGVQGPGGTGTTNQLTKFTNGAVGIIGDSILSDDGSDLTLSAGSRIYIITNLGDADSYLGGEENACLWGYNRQPSSGLIDDPTKDVYAFYMQHGIGMTWAADTAGTFTLRMRLLTSGNLGVGITTPLTRLHLLDTSNASNYNILTLTNNNTNTNNDVGVRFVSCVSGGGTGLYNTGRILSTFAGSTYATAFVALQTPTAENTWVSALLVKNGNVTLPNDNSLLILGAGGDASITYDGTNLVVNPKLTGSGILDVTGVIQTDGYNAADGSTGISSTISPLTFKNGLLTANSGGSLVGATGVQGVTGLQGVQGVTGLQGVQGQTGLRGTTGLQGTTGVQGATGLQGTTGIGVAGTGTTNYITKYTNGATPTIGNSSIQDDGSNITVGERVCLRYNQIGYDATANKGISFDSAHTFFLVNSTEVLGDTRGSMLIYDDTAYGTGVGGGLTFYGKSSTNYSAFAGIKGVKSNSISGNSDGELQLQTTNNGEQPKTRLIISGYGCSILTSTPSSGDAQWNLVLYDSATYGQGVGGGIVFEGNVNSNSYSPWIYAGIKGVKANSTESNGAGELHFQVRANSADPATKMKILEDGTVNISTCVDSGTDTDKFLVLDSSGNVDYRTGVELLADCTGTTEVDTDVDLYLYNNPSTLIATGTCRVVISNKTVTLCFKNLSGNITTSCDLLVNYTLPAPENYETTDQTAYPVCIKEASTNVKAGFAVYAGSNRFHLYDYTFATFTGSAAGIRSCEIRYTIA